MAKDLFFIPLGGSGGGGDLTNYYTKAEVNALIADFVTASTNDLINYYLKSETYTQAEVNSLIGSIESIHFEFAASTSDVQDPQSNVIYLIGPSGTGADQYEEYVYANNQWKKIGDTSIDLSGYATTTDLQNAINTAMATLQQYAVDNFYQKSEVDAMIAQVQTLQGIQGATGASIQGIQGATGASIQGLQGIQGATGASIQGLQGEQGIQGPAGGGSGSGVETVELTELTESELGELYEIVVNEDPISFAAYLAEHRLVAYGMPVISWNTTQYTVDAENNTLIADEEGEIGAAFFAETKIEKEAATPDTITAYWYCIFKQEEGGNYTYVLEEGTNTYENNGGGGVTRYDISTKSQAELADFYQNWERVMASNNVYVGVYPVTGIVENYTLGDYTGLLVEYNINFTNYSTQTDTGTASIRNVAGSVGAYFILANGYAQNATDVSNIATVDYVNQRLGGLVYLQFVLADDSVENYRLYNANVPL